MEADLQRVGRNEWWLWLSAFAVTVLSAATFLLSWFHSLFLHQEHFYEIRPEQARWATLSLLLIFNGWLVYRQWLFRRQRSRLTSRSGEAEAKEGAKDWSRMDEATGLYTRASLEQQLGKEVARSRRRNVPLSLVAFHLDDFAQINRRLGPEAGKQVLVEFADRLRKASRGCDYCARIGNDDFLMVLPECSLAGAKIVSERVGTPKVKCGGEEMEVTYSVGWIDYKRGEVPSDLLKRAADVLRLYKEAS